MAFAQAFGKAASIFPMLDYIVSEFIYTVLCIQRVGRRWSKLGFIMLRVYHTILVVIIFLLFPYFLCLDRPLSTPYPKDSCC
jgi:hypothetical protein